MNPILVALDVESAAKAVELADALRGSVGGFKIGKQLFTAAGPAMVFVTTSEPGALKVAFAETVVSTVSVLATMSFCAAFKPAVLWSYR